MKRNRLVNFSIKYQALGHLAETVSTGFVFPKFLGSMEL